MYKCIVYLWIVCIVILVHYLVWSIHTHITDPNDIILSYLKAALQDGFIPHKDDLFLIHGPGGVGKSSLISMLLGKQRDLARRSTAVAEESLHVCPVRDVSTKTFTPKWEEVKTHRLSRMVVHTSLHLICKKQSGKDEDKKNEHNQDQQWIEEEISQPIEEIPTEATPKPSISNVFTKFVSFLQSSMAKFMKKSPRETSEPSVPSLATTLEDDPDNIMGHFAKFQEELQDLILESKEMNDFIH